MEAFVYGAVAAIVVALLVGQQLRRRQLATRPILEAPVPRLTFIATSLITSLALLAAAVAGMAAMLEAWQGALGFGAVAAALVGSLYATRKPVATVTLDSGARVLSAISASETSRVDLGNPFQLHAATKMILLPRRHPWMVVTVEQGPQRISFCFPWSFSELTRTPKGETDQALPALVLDWRGGLMYERLLALSRSSVQGETAPPSAG